MISHLTSCNLVLREGEDKELRDYFVSYDKLKRTGWAPSVALGEGLKELVAHYG